MKQRFRLRAQRGFTLVEQLVVITMISIVGTVGFSLLLVILGAYWQNQNSYLIREQKAALNTYLFEAGYNIKAGDLAPNLQNPAAVQAVSLAGDQLTWCYNRAFNGHRWCVRIFYVAHMRRVFEIQAPEGAYGAIAPVRGPNQTVPAWEDCPAPCYVAPPGSPLHDQVLDTVFQEMGGGANQIASNVSLGEADITSTTVTRDNAPFRYLSAGREPLTFIPAQANSSTLALTLAQKAQIGQITFDFYLQPPNTMPLASVSPLHYKYPMSVTPSLY